MVDTPFLLINRSIGVYNNDVVMRVVMAMVVVMIVFMNDNRWFVSDDYFVSPYHRCEC